MRLCIALAALTLSACSMFAKKPSYDYYVLSPAPPPHQTPRSGSDGALPVLVVGEVTMPGYLDRESLATRVAPYQIAYSKRDRWAEPLDVAFERTLRQDLAGILVSEDVSVQADRMGRPPEYTVEVDVLRFERSSPDRVHLWARYTIRSGGRIVHEDEARIAVRAPGADSDATSEALSRAVARLSEDIAGAVQGVEPVADARLDDLDDLDDLD